MRWVSVTGLVAGAGEVSGLKRDVAAWWDLIMLERMV